VVCVRSPLTLLILLAPSFPSIPLSLALPPSLTEPACAGTGRAVQWQTPLGLPVVQPYRKTGEVAVRTVVQVRRDSSRPMIFATRTGHR
jgi:hypothetical protein